MTSNTEQMKKVIHLPSESGMESQSRQREETSSSAAGSEPPAGKVARNTKRRQEKGICRALGEGCKDPEGCANKGF